MRFEPDLANAAAFLQAADMVRNQRQRMIDARSDGVLTEDEEWLASVCEAMAERIMHMAEPNARERLAALMNEARNSALRAASDVVRSHESIETPAGPGIRARPEGAKGGLGYIRAILALEAMPDLEPEIVEALDAGPTLP